MQNVLITILMAADVFIALIIIALVLVQQSKEGALGSSFGGVGESVFGAHTGGHLAKLTVIFSILFLSITLALAIIIGHRAQPRGIVDRELSLKKAPTKTIEEPKENISSETAKIATEEKIEAEKILSDTLNAIEKKTTEEKKENTPATK